MKSSRKHHSILQNTDDWFRLRLKKSTSSNFDKICANMGKAFGNPAIKYAQKKALERVTGILDDTDSFSNKYTDRGDELEPIARELYEEETFNSVENGGFFEFGNLGDSPDGLVGLKGCIEIKCVIPNTHWERIKKDDYDKSYKGQIQGHLYVGGREWCDFVSYCPEFPEGKRIFIKRVFVDEDYQKLMIERLQEFEEKIIHFQKMIS